jgi:hypothetical protein
MVELENFHLVSFRGIEISGLITLMQLQNNYIHQICTNIYSLCVEFNMTDSFGFKEFIKHFNAFMQSHARSEGFSKAMETIEVYNYILVEKLLDSDVMIAAEELEIAIVYLEMLIYQSQIKTNKELLLINRNIDIIEETQLKIIEFLKNLLNIFNQKHVEN